MAYYSTHPSLPTWKHEVVAFGVQPSRQTWVLVATMWVVLALLMSCTNQYEGIDFSTHKTSGGNTAVIDTVFDSPASLER